MTKYVYEDENGNTHLISEEELPKCPITGGVPPSICIIGNMRNGIYTEHIECRGEGNIFCKAMDLEVEKNDCEKI